MRAQLSTGFVSRRCAKAATILQAFLADAAHPQSALNSYVGPHCLEDYGHLDGCRPSYPVEQLADGFVSSPLSACRAGFRVKCFGEPKGWPYSPLSRR